MTTCEYTLQRGSRRGSQCSRPTVDGTIYCKTCVLNRALHPLPLTRPEVSPQLRSIFKEAEKLKVKQQLLHVKYTHPLKHFSLVRFPDRALVHFVKNVEQAADLRPGDILVIKDQPHPTIHQESTLDRSDYPLLYWEPLMHHRRSIELTPEIRAKCTQSEREGGQECVTFMQGNVEHKIVLGSWSPGTLSERLERIEELWLRPDHIDDVVEGRNVLYEITC